MLLRWMVTLAVPASVASIAFLHAHAIGSLVDATATPSSVAPFAEARAAASTGVPASKSADAFLAHNVFDHTMASLLPLTAATNDADDDLDPLTAPACEGVRALVSVHADDVDGSFAALDVGGRRLLRRRGGEIADWRVMYVAADRVWLAHDGKLCQARVFGDVPPAPQASGGASSTPPQSALEKDITGKIAKTGPNEFQIDRGAVDRIIEAQAELMRTPLIPEKEGDRVVGFRLVRVRPGSVISALGLQTGDRLVSLNGIEVTSTERMLEAYAKLRTGTIDRLTIHVVRNGTPTNIDYLVR